MAAVGKKKRKIYIVRSKKGSILPLLIGGGILAYFLLKNSSASSTTTTTNSGGDGTIPAGGTSSNNNPVLVDDGSGTGTHVIQPTPVTIVPGSNMSVVNTIAASDRQALLRDMAAMPGAVAALGQMTSQEIIDTYNYFYNYYQFGKILTRYPDPAYPGQWNTQLYDGIQVIKSKYHIF